MSEKAAFQTFFENQYGFVFSFERHCSDLIACFFHFHDFQYSKLENTINESFPENSKCREFGAIRHEWYRVNAYTNMMLSIIQFAALEVVSALYECVDVKVTEPALTYEGLKVFFYDADDVLTIQQWMLEEARK